MSYLQKIEYRIVPETSFQVKHNCGGCGCKRSFVNTRRFRVNANGSRLDVWLIYQCECCKHTLNVAIYERTRPDRIPKEEYLRFLANDEQLAEEYGRNYAFFKHNRLEVEQEAVTYRLECVEEVSRLESVMDETPNTPVCNTAVSAVKDVSGEVQILIHNPYGLKLRPERLAAQVLGFSRSKVKREQELGHLEILQERDTIQIMIKGEGKYVLGNRET